MKILFVSNDITHHLVPFFKSLCEQYGEDNCTFAVLHSSPDRLKMGFPIYEESWVYEVYKNGLEDYKKKWKNADLIITRVWDDVGLIEDSLQKGKIVFYASERWFKPFIGKLRLLVPSYFRRFFDFRKLSKFNNFYYLAMGFYASNDFQFLGICRNRIFNFGYFTPTFNIPTLKDENKKKTVEILWAGRMLGWKRVIDLLSVFGKIEKKYDIHLSLIGDGPTRQKLVQYVNTNQISNVTFKKYVPNVELKRLMCNTDIYVLPSSGYEGWGAVINEAMQTKCAVIASEEIGAARSMIVNGKNGITFLTGNRKDLENSLIKLIENKELLNQIKEEAYKTITYTWSAQEAGKRFAIIVDRIKNGQSYDIFKDGPMQIIG